VPNVRAKRYAALWRVRLSEMLDEAATRRKPNRLSRELICTFTPRLPRK